MEHLNAGMHHHGFTSEVSGRTAPATAKGHDAGAFNRACKPVFESLRDHPASGTNQVGARA